MSEHRDLEGLTALVTGATSGIGQAAARQLARHGAEVIVHGRDVIRGQAVVDAITADSGQARVQPRRRPGEHRGIGSRLYPHPAWRGHRGRRLHHHHGASPPSPTRSPT